MAESSYLSSPEFFPAFSRPFPPPKLGKKSGSGKMEGRVCPGKGQIHAAKTGAGFSVAGVVFKILKPKK
jgi:hypothetical protein